MNLNEYKSEIFRHLKVKTIGGMKANRVFDELFHSETLDYRKLETWKYIYDQLHGEKLVTKRSANSKQNKATKAKSSGKHKPSYTDLPVGGELITLTDKKGETAGVLVQYDQDQSKALIDHFRNMTLNSPSSWHGGNLNTAVVDQLGIASTAVMAALQAGQVMRVVGPPSLVAGLANGTLQLVQTSGAAIGTVKHVASGKFAGQLLLKPSSMTPIIAPIVAYQVLHAIVGTP